jgi:phytoene dehydrogenase-like protein
MTTSTHYDAIVIGAGPNGLAAAITLARAGQSVLIVEARETIGGGTRSAELTLPGFLHDVCSAIHPLGAGSPFYRSLPLADYGLTWIQPTLPLAHPLDDGTAVALDRSIEATAANLGIDNLAYRQLMKPLVADWDKLAPNVLGPLRLPQHPVALARFAQNALLPAHLLAKLRFRGDRAQALFAGMAAHAIMPLGQPLTAAFGLMLGVLGHVVGWPLPAGGSQQIAEAMAKYFRSLGGEIITGRSVENLADLPAARVIMFDLTPRQVLRLAQEELPPTYRAQLLNYRYGPGVFKLDLAIDEPIPWSAAECRQAGTVHLGATLEEITAAEQAVWDGRHPERPYVLVAQQSLFDSSRAPAGKHTVWAYCHVPNGSTVDMTEAIEAQIERFAPGFRDTILARSQMNTAAIESYNQNYIGGDINGGVQDMFQLYTRPALRLIPYRTPNPKYYICSSSTPPGGGVHGMCGYHAAKAALRYTLKA